VVVNFTSLPQFILEYKIEIEKDSTWVV